MNIEFSYPCSFFCRRGASRCRSTRTSSARTTTSWSSPPSGASSSTTTSLTRRRDDASPLPSIQTMWALGCEIPRLLLRSQLTQPMIHLFFSTGRYKAKTLNPSRLDGRLPRPEAQVLRGRVRGLPPRVLPNQDSQERPLLRQARLAMPGVCQVGREKNFDRVF